MPTKRTPWPAVVLLCPMMQLSGALPLTKPVSSCCPVLWNPLLPLTLAAVPLLRKLSMLLSQTQVSFLGWVSLLKDAGL